MRKALIFLIMVVFLPSLCFAQAKVGTAGAQFLEIGVSARAMGLGEAFLGIVDDASALYYNPAGLTQLESKEAMLTHIEYPADIKYDFAGLVYPTPNFGGVWGLAFYVLNTGEMPLTTPDHPLPSDVTFIARDFAAGLSYARGLTDRFSIGFTFKFVQEAYGEEKATGWAADMGTLYNSGYKGFKVAMVISNFGPDFKFLKENYPLPMNFKFGGTMEVLNNHVHKTTLNLEGSHPNDNLEKYNFGIEHWYKDTFAARIGYNLEYDTGGISVGLGVKLPLSYTNLKVDYGYHDFGYLEEIHKFSLGLVF
ncbi:MAG: PorV/PorQ family protein [Candidatus Zixiibacteriota bacterium]